jgi:hypothetical protein
MAENQETSANKSALWSEVQETDPRYTKTFNRAGGFKGTSTNATWLAKRATEVFGPCGIGWGVKVLDEQIIEGHPITDTCNTKVHKVRVQFWYVLDGVRGEIEQFGQTEMVGKNSKGLYTDEEAPKKSITDAMTKCMSLLGFAADIHLGLYDDNKYVNDLKQHYGRDKIEDVERDPAGQDGAEGRTTDPRRDAPQPPQRDSGARLTPQQHTTAMRNAKTEADLKRAFAVAWKQYENPNDPAAKTPAQLKLKEVYDSCLTKLKTKEQADPPGEPGSGEEFMPE